MAEPHAQVKALLARAAAAEKRSADEPILSGHPANIAAGYLPRSFSPDQLILATNFRLRALCEHLGIAAEDADVSKELHTHGVAGPSTVQSPLRTALDIANAAIKVWEESTSDPAPGWCVTNGLLQAISAEEGISIGELVDELKEDT